MKITHSKISGLIIIEPKVYSDSRGYFFESYTNEKFKNEISQINFIQDNESMSYKGVLRGLHFQKFPYEQSKLVRCIQGEVLDVAVDLREKSKTFGEYFSIILSEKNKKQLFIPKGFAHGYVVLSDKAIFSYKVDSPYRPDFDSGIIWNDNNLKIDWILNDNELIISEKDKKLSTFKKHKL